MAGRSGQRKAPWGFPRGLHHFFNLLLFQKFHQYRHRKEENGKNFHLITPSFRNHHLLPRLGI
nr:MAG TPA: hypothetical protein [Bacteriophage sp.]